MSKTQDQSIRVVKSTYFSNWGDRLGYPLAALIVKPLAKIKFLTPNHVTLVAFSMFALGCVFLALDFPYHLPLAAFLIFFGYVGDDIDGQLARITKKHSVLGDYLDKVLDILKIFLITFFTGLAAYLQTGHVFYLMLGFIAGFMFMYRYYLKLETMYSAFSRDPKYFETSAAKRHELEADMDQLYARQATSLTEAAQLFWIKNRTLLLVDEAEFAIIVALGALVGRLDIALWIIAIAQVFWVVWRLIERGTQLTTNSERLKWPLRK
jgi:phosphatidylglycerophosphate synthase